MNLTNKPFEKLARGSYYLILSNLTNLTIGALFWIILAKMVDPAALGEAMVVIALATSVIGFAGYGVQVMVSKYMAEYIARDMPNTSRNVLKLGIKIGVIVAGSAAVSIALLSEQIATMAYNNPSLSTLLIVAVLIYLPSQTIITTLRGAFIGTHRTQYHFVTHLIHEIAKLGIAVTLVLYGLSSFGILVGFSVASLIVLTVGFVYLVPRVLPKPTERLETTRGVRHMVKFSGLNYSAVGMRTLSAQIGVVILGTLSFEWAAFYGLSVLISTVVGGVLIAVSKAIVPTASEQWAKGNKKEFSSVFNTAVRLSLLISGFGFLILMIDPSYVLSLISKSYAEASSALRILVLSSIISSIGAIIISMLNAAGRPTEVARIGLISSAITITLTFVLAPTIGLIGAAIAMLLGSISSLSLSVVTLKRKEQVSLSIRSVMKPTISIIVGLIFGYSLFILSNNVILSIVLSVLSYAGFSLMYRATTQAELKSILSLVLRTTRS
ncbi:MAG: oligosaccharide flippase family protein [Nitrososphaerales archaeon]